jgi:hypothetical protein
VRASNASRPFAPDPPYDESFHGLPVFKTLREAEQTLLRLEALRREFAARGDRRGLTYCRKVGLIARRRAEGIAANYRVERHKRAVKREIGRWFAIWLETPDLFERWLELRKRTAEYEGLARTESGAV